MLNPSDLDVLRQERQRLQQALAALDALRPAAPPPVVEEEEPSEPPPVPFIRPLGFADVVWDEPEESPPEEAPMDRAGDFTTFFDPGDAAAPPPAPPASVQDAMPDPESTETRPQTTHDAFTDFNWE